MKVHEVIKKLVLTENTYNLVESQGTFVFRVPREANKIVIRNAVEKAFGVRTLSANTSVMPSKKKPVRGRQGVKGIKPAYKKAFVKVHGEDISKIPLI